MEKGCRVFTKRFLNDLVTSRLPKKWFSSFSVPALESCAQRFANGAEIVDVCDVANEMREKVRHYTSLQSKPVRLAAVLAETAEMEASKVYAEKVAVTLSEDGIDFELAMCASDKPSDVSNAIHSLNERTDVHGILVFYPIFKSQSQNSGKRGPYLNRPTGVFYKSDDDWIRDTVRADKDVEGLRRSRMSSRMFRARSDSDQIYIPCTAMGVLSILRAYFGEAYEGEQVTIVNRSEIFGRPLAAILAQKGASVYSIDELSILEFRPHGRLRRRNDIDITQCIRESKIVITGVPSRNFNLPIEAVSPGSFVIDISECSNVDDERLMRIPGVTLIPHVGKVTVATLETNLINLHKESNH